MRKIRWSDNDRHFGPFTYSRDSSRRWNYAFLVYTNGSRDDDDGDFCQFRASAFGHTILAPLPRIIKPLREKVYPKSWDAETVKRLGRNWYYNYIRRSYGFNYSDGFLQVYYGLDTDDSRNEQRWSCFLPWTQWRFVRHSLYGLDGEHFWTEKDNRDWNASRAAQNACPSLDFEFFDFDGELIKAATLIEEREWRFGSGKFKWLSLFKKPKIRRSLNIKFSKEVGPRKGSWKGGTIGHSIDLLPGEDHEMAFRRYCSEHNLRFREPERLWFRTPAKASNGAQTA